MRIDTEIKSVSVEIGDKEYPVAEKTVEVAERLRKAKMDAAKSGKMEYELWREHLEILLGRAAAKELFPAGKTENLDRMELIYYGVMDAFNANGREVRDERVDASLSEAKALAEYLKPVGELVALLKAEPAKVSPFPAIRKPL